MEHNQEIFMYVKYTIEMQVSCKPQRLDANILSCLVYIIFCQNFQDDFQDYFSEKILVKDVCKSGTNLLLIYQ